MTAIASSPADRASFNKAMKAILDDHAALRHLVLAMTTRTTFSADDVMSLADAVAAHESTEAQLFALPFLTRAPAIVNATAARARQRCIEYTSGNFRLPGPGAAAGLFVDALLAHLAAEEAWLAHEDEHQKERLQIHD